MYPENIRVAGLLRRLALSAKPTGVLLIILIILLGTQTAQAMEIAEWRFQTSLYTKHWDPDPEHVNNQKLLNIEFETTNRWIYGLYSVFV